MWSQLPAAVQLNKRLMALPWLLLVGLCGPAQAQTVSLDQVAPIALTTSSVVSAVQINPSTGNVTVRTSNGTYNACSFTPPQVPTINTFAPTSSQVSPGATITLNWTSSNATHCTPQNGPGTVWASLGQLPANGSQNLTAPTNNGTISFQLTCTDGTQSDVESTQVTVQTTTQNCTATYPNVTEAEFNQTFNIWPAFGSSRRIFAPFNGSLAFRFTASAVANQFGTFATVGFPGDGDGFGQASISRGPGCFNAAQLGPNCVSPVAREPSVGWANFANQFSCALTPGQVYYVNLTYGGTTTPGSGPYCPGGSCGADAQNQIQD